MTSVMWKYSWELCGSSMFKYSLVGKVENPSYSGKDSGVSQFVEEVIPNQDWLRTKDQAIKNILENDNTIGDNVDYKSIEDNPQFDFKVKDEVIKIHSKQLESNVIDEKTFKAPFINLPKVFYYKKFPNFYPINIYINGRLNKLLSDASNSKLENFLEDIYAFALDFVVYYKNRRLVEKHL